VRTIGVVTTSRADYGHYVPLLRAIQSDPELRLKLLVSGMHLCPEFGLTVREIAADGFPIEAEINALLASDSPEAIAKSMGIAVLGFAQAFATLQPEILVVLGDRFEMHAAAVAALPFKIPVAHISGGDITEGAIDDPLRHSITKLSHLHFVAGDEQAGRVHQMGEEPWRISVTGELSLDVIKSNRRLSAAEMHEKFGIEVDRPFLLVTYHPVTLEYEDTGRQIKELLSALTMLQMPVVFTLPNADTAGRLIASEIRNYVATKRGSWLVDSLGQTGYISAMALAAAMVGNSSSGIIEAASFELPVVNIGNRQRGRLRARNVIDCGYSCEEIVAAARNALSSEFRNTLRGLTNPYGSGDAAARIVQKLKAVSLGESFIKKRFLACATPSSTF
jgi:UDP-hydrolysing UDP-N-acetyl-D-glucosamine 2-epimerase